MDQAVAWGMGVRRVPVVPSMFVPLTTTPTPTTTHRLSSRIRLTAAVMEDDSNDEACGRVPILQQEPPLVGISINNKDNHPPPTPTTLTTTTIGSSPNEVPRVVVVDILLNRKAKGVTPTMIKVVEDVVADYSQSNSRLLQVRIHATSTLEQARTVVEEMSHNPPSLMIPVGGDGTLTKLLQLLWESGMDVSCPRSVMNVVNGNDDDDGLSSTSPQTRRRFPPIAYIAQGTGNALGSVVGCRPPRQKGQGWRWAWWRRRPSFLGGTPQTQYSVLAETLHQLLCTVEQGHPNNSTTSMDIVELPMIQVTTTISQSQEQQSQQEQIKKAELCFFSGVGFDSLMLQDYKDLQEWTHEDGRPLRRRLFKEALSSVAGYCVALVTRTLPRCVHDQQHLIQVRVSTSNPHETVWIDHRRGDIVRSVQTNDNNNNDNNNNNKDLHPHLLYQGEAGIVAVGSAPFYGGGLRLFPFARMTTNGMQLRIGRIHPLRGTMNLPQIFQGSYRDLRDDAFGCLDFMGPQFSITILNPTTGYPVQHSGDFIGTSKQIDYRMMTMGGEELLDPIQFVTLLPPRVVIVEEDV